MLKKNILFINTNNKYNNNTETYNLKLDNGKYIKSVKKRETIKYLGWTLS